MGKKLSELNFTNRLLNSASFLYVKVEPTPLVNPRLLHLNSDLLTRLEIDQSSAQSPSFLRFINGDLDFEGLFFSSTFYSGHQFGHYVPRLGDGRAIFMGELKTTEGLFYELQLKGAGLTPFSRMGDGKAVVRSSIREYLSSVHLKALGIPTTEALSIIAGESDVYREEIEKEAIVLRSSESFLRFGHFQYYAHTNQLEELKTLVDSTIENYFPDFSHHENKYVLFYQDVVKRTAKLFAHWQAVGFCHGVLNTDNMSILGLTIDYGPYGFIENFNQDFICNHSDHEGRYSLGNQPGIGMWNLDQLGGALKSLISHEDKERTLETYPPLFLYEYRRLLLEKCGLFLLQENDDDFLKELLNMLELTRVDYTQFFRKLSHYSLGDREIFSTIASQKLSSWLDLYDTRLEFERLSFEERKARMLRTNPKFILRNYLAQMAIEDTSLLSKIFDVLANPFDEWSEFDQWSNEAPMKYKNLAVSCSS